MRLKRGCLGAVSLLVALLSVTNVQAFMTDRCTLENLITMRQGEMRAVLTEPSWNPQLGLNLVPGEEVPKDPRVTNTSTREVSILVAIRLSFVSQDSGVLLTSEQMGKISPLLLIDFDADKDTGLWKRYEGESQGDEVQHFYYTRSLKRNLSLGQQEGESTRPLFTQVSLPSWVTNPSFEGLRSLDGFALRLEACAIEYDGDEELAGSAAGQAALEGSFQWEEELGGSE